MPIQQLLMKLIQCDYNIYNIVVLGFFIILITFYLVAWPITNPKILQKLPYDKTLWIVQFVFTNKSLKMILFRLYE
jgi:hypothetical protein